VPRGTDDRCIMVRVPGWWQTGEHPLRRWLDGADSWSRGQGLAALLAPASARERSSFPQRSSFLERGTRISGFIAFSPEEIARPSDRAPSVLESIALSPGEIARPIGSKNRTPPSGPRSTPNPSSWTLR
jgi:hypothetical protein